LDIQKEPISSRGYYWLTNILYWHIVKVSLNLDVRGITNLGLRSLATLTRLERLDLFGVNCTDKVLHLFHLPSSPTFFVFLLTFFTFPSDLLFLLQLPSSPSFRPSSSSY
jgi:hypothetical protein